MEELRQVSREQSVLLVATGQLIGEGFDYPRLDTLIMAMPVAWKGVVEQYAGLIHMHLLSQPVRTHCPREPGID